MTSVTTTLFFWSGGPDEFALAKQLKTEERDDGRKALTRDAFVYAGEIEDCDRIMFLPSVRPSDIKRLTKLFEGHAKVVPYERAEAVTATTPDPPPPVVHNPEATALPLSLHPTLKVEDLRRLTNRQLVELADARGVQCASDNRWDIIAALRKVE